MKSVAIVRPEGVNKYPRPKNHEHMHCSPSFLATSPHVIVRRLHAAIETHNWRQNPFANEARLFSGQRLAIRSEARITLKALCKAIAYFLDYIDGSKQFEVWANIPYLAKRIGAMYLVNDERIRYDVVYHALELLEAMQAVHLVRDYDHATKRFKLSRVFVLPAFFRMFGFTDKEVRSLIQANRATLAKLPAHELEKISSIWVSRRCTATEKAKIRGAAAQKKINWTQKHYKQPANDPVNLSLINNLKGAVQATGQRTDFTTSKESIQRARLRANISQAELFKLRQQLAEPGMTAVDIELAVDLHLAEHTRE